VSNNQSGAFYAHYRASTVGLTLEDVLEELTSAGRLRETEAALVRAQFDQVVARYLRKRVSQRSALRGRLSHYNLRDNVWTFLVRHALLRLESRPEKYAVTERLPKLGGGGPVTGSGGANAATATESHSGGTAWRGLLLPPRSESREVHSLNPQGLGSTSRDANAQTYIYADRLRLICTAADANMVKATSGSSRQKRPIAPTRSRARPRLAPPASTEERGDKQ
jgi:transcription initiation factor TFIIA small subunit